VPAQHNVPPDMLRSYERMLESCAPPKRATATLRPESLPRRALENVVTFAYGHLHVMRAPQNVVRDSRQRVLVADPAIPAVHVLDPKSNSSFRIVGGPGRRIQSVSDVDVDADDNIYVADAARGVLLVFDPQGRFLREMGTFHGETMYDQITAIAIDRRARHLYVADGPANQISMLDLEGNLLKWLGQGRSNTRPGELIRREAAGAQQFNYPTDIAIGDGYVAVLDSAGTRVRLMDADGTLMGGFTVQQSAEDRAYAIGIDRRGNIYVSYPDISSIRVYSAHGQVLGALGYAGGGVGQFLGPEGLWIDDANRLYVADTKNARVELFQLASAE